jgi:hypothetical protein
MVALVLALAWVYVSAWEPMTPPVTARALVYEKPQVWELRTAWEMTERAAPEARHSTVVSTDRSHCH